MHSRARFAVLIALSLLVACADERTDSAQTAPAPATSIETPAAAPSAPQGPPAPLPVLPGEPPAFVDAALLEKLKRRDAANDVWSSEVFAERASAQLEKLGELMARSGELDEAMLAPLIDASFRAAPLRPDGLVGVRDAFGVRVQRASEIQPESTFDGLAGAVEALRALAAPFASDVASEFELLTVDERGDGVETLAHVRIAGRAAAGLLQQNATWRVRWTPNDASAPPRITSIAVSEFSEVAAAAPLFEDCTEAVLGANASYSAQLAPGLEHWSATLDSALGTSLIGGEGFALGDVDGDSLDDLYLCQPGGLPNLLFVHQKDGTLRDATRESGADFLDASRGALFADFDNDGDQDLAVALELRVVFLANDGRGRFTLAFDAPAPDATSLSAADFDADGDLDLYACASAELDGANATPLPYHDADNGRPNALLRNDGAWKFVDATREVGLDRNNRRFSSAAAWEDYDGDGDQDLFVANDFGRANLYRNDGGRFSDVASEARVRSVSAATSVTWADYDLDGLADVFVSNRSSPARHRVARQSDFMPGASDELRASFAGDNSLFRNLGDGSFADVSDESNYSRSAHGALFLDFDNDGRPDLHCPNGGVSGEDAEDLDGFFWRQVAAFSPTHGVPRDLASYDAGWHALREMLSDGKSWSGRQRDVSFLNAGANFVDVSGISGLDLVDDTRAAARCDWDLDGSLDLWVAGRCSPRVHFLRNRAQNAGAFVAVRLRGTTSNRDAIGARVEVRREVAPALVQTLRAGEGALAQSSAWMHFGLAEHGGALKVVVRWPAPHADASHAVEEFELAANSRAVLVQGSGRAEPWKPAASSPVLKASDPPSLPLDARSRTVLAERVLMPPLLMISSAGPTGDVVASLGKPLLVNLWATGSTASVADLRALAEHSDELKSAGLNVVAVACDDAQDRDAALELLERLQWPMYAGYATPELLDTLDVLQRATVERRRRLPLPSSFLLDHDGRVAVIYRGPLELATLLADVSRLRATPAETRDAAVPFAGRWLASVGAPSLARYVLAFAERGMSAAADAIAQAQPRAQATSDAGVYNEFGLAKARAGRLQDALADFQRAVELDPALFDARTNFAAALHQTGRVTEALPQYEAALRLDGRHAATIFNLALARWALGDRDGARQELALLELCDAAMAKELATQLEALAR